MSQVVTRAARAGDVDALAAFWQTHMNDRPGIGRWRSIAHCPWYTDPPNHGWIALARGNIVGAMALVHSQRRIRSRTEKLCNIGSLYVLKPYRGRGLARTIARESTADESISYFGIDAAPQTRAVLEPAPVGFRILDDQRYVWRPRAAHGSDSITILAGHEVAQDAVPQAERGVFDHHVALGMFPLIIQSAGQQCRALLWNRNKDSDTIYHEVFYMSDAALFAAHAQSLADRLLEGRNAVLAADSRFFADVPPHATTEPLKQSRHYKSSRLSPNDIDLLYSEVPLLGLKLS